MNKLTTSTAIPTRALKLEALSKISASFELFCLASGIEALGEMMDRDAQAICGPRHARGRDRRAHRWGKTKGKIGFHGGKVEIERPRLRGFDGKEQPVPSWEAAVAEDWLGKWALNQMLINVATRKFARSVRLPEGDVPRPAGAGLSKSAASRRFVALSAARMKDWMASDLSDLDLLAIQRCQIHKARNIMERLPKSLHASVRCVLRQAWELDDAAKAERLLRNLAQRLEREWSGVAGSILEGIDEILTVTRLGLPKELRRSLACTNIIENVMGTVRRVCRNVKRWRSAAMAMRWTAAALQEAAKGFRRLKAHKQLPALRTALEATASLLAK